MNPDAIAPMFATSGPVPRRTGEWAYEVKWDGVRAVATVRDGSVHLRSRPRGTAAIGNDITTRYPELEELGEVGMPGVDGDALFVIDGEVVMFDDDGRPSFPALQHRMHVADPAESRRLAAERSVVFVAFDLLWGPDGSYLDLTYDERRDRLGDLVFVGERVLVPSAEFGEPDALIDFVKARGLEGIVAKRRNSVYRPGRRSQAWIKSKFFLSQEMVVLGWTEGTGGRSKHLGALLLGYHDTDGTMRFGGKVGTGFNDTELRVLRETFADCEIDDAPVAIPRQKTAVHWVEPTMVVEVGFAEWSPDGHLRHPTYRGRRIDKAPEDVVREG